LINAINAEGKTIFKQKILLMALYANAKRNVKNAATLIIGHMAFLRLHRKDMMSAKNIIIKKTKNMNKKLPNIAPIHL